MRPELIPGDELLRTLLICDHASNHMPPELNNLGLDPQALNQHIAIDLGAAPLTRRLARDLSAPAVLSSTSRLVIDLNRMPGSEASIPRVSHGVTIPGNFDISPSEAVRRRNIYFKPYHDQVAQSLELLETRQSPASIISIHSFTPNLDAERPWHLGVLWDGDERFAHRILAALKEKSDLVVGANQPYPEHSSFGYTCQTHGDAKGRPNVIFELRQDLIDTVQGVNAMANLLSPLITEVSRSIQQQGNNDGK